MARADIARWIPQLAPEDASRGYYLGLMLLEFLAPKSNCETLHVPVSTDILNRTASAGVLDRDILALQTKAALDTLKIVNPDKVVTLGGECSVSVPVFTYLADKYSDDIVVAHPDIILPGDDYTGYHVMALTVAESMPRPAIRLKQMLSELPLL